MGFGLTGYIPPLVYVMALTAAAVSLARPKIGLFFLVPLLPFQNVLHRLHEFPRGDDVVDFLFVGILIGWFYNVRNEDGRILTPHPMNKYALALIGVSGISLLYGSLYFGLPLPFSLADLRLLDWKNFIMLPIVYFMVLNLVQTEKEIKLLLLLMLVGLFVADGHYAMAMRYKSLEAFHWSRKISGILKTVGGNELAAFYAQFIFLPIGLFFGVPNRWFKAALAGLATFTVYPILFLFSRGAYVGFGLALLYVGFKRSWLLVAAVVLLVLMWNVVLPGAIVDRINMTEDPYGELDHSAASRLDLWKECLRQFGKSPIFGVGFRTFRLAGLGKNDPHNAYFEVLAEQGLLGLGVFLAVLFMTFSGGAALAREANDPVLRGLGTAIAAATVACAVTNLFGDRWTYIQLQAWFWTFAALAARARILIQRAGVEHASRDAVDASAKPLAAVATAGPRDHA